MNTLNMIGKRMNQVTGMMLLAALCLHSCNVTEEVVDNGSAPSQVERVVGTIMRSDECGYFIQVIQGDVARSYYPVNLEDKYKVEEMKIKFAFVEAKAKVPDGCQDLIPVNVSDLTPTR